MFVQSFKILDIVLKDHSTEVLQDPYFSLKKQLCQQVKTGNHIRILFKQSAFKIKNYFF